MSEIKVGIEMPKYNCHKQVYALHIKNIVMDSDVAKTENRETDGSALLEFFEEPYAPIKVNREYLSKHKPEVGGYYVVYQDGYKSFSPQKAFEDGYTKA